MLNSGSVQFFRSNGFRSVWNLGLKSHGLTPRPPQGECKCSTTLPQFGLSLIRGATKLKPIDVTDQHAGRCPVKPKGKIQTKGDSKHEATTSELHDHNGVICTVQCGATVQYYHNKTGNITNSLQKEKLLPTDTGIVSGMNSTPDFTLSVFPSHES